RRQVVAALHVRATLDVATDIGATLDVTADGRAALGVAADVGGARIRLGDGETECQEQRRRGQTGRGQKLSLHAFLLRRCARPRTGRRDSPRHFCSGDASDYATWKRLIAVWSKARPSPGFFGTTS